MPALIIPEDQVQQTILDACRILIKMRYYRQRFEQNHDAGTKVQMKLWEERADVFIKSLQIDPLDELDQKVAINKQQ